MRCVRPVRQSPYLQVIVPPDIQAVRLSLVLSARSVRKL